MSGRQWHKFIDNEFCSLIGSCHVGQLCMPHNAYWKRIFSLNCLVLEQQRSMQSLTTILNMRVVSCSTRLQATTPVPLSNQHKPATGANGKFAYTTNTNPWKKVLHPTIYFVINHYLFCASFVSTRPSLKGVLKSFTIINSHEYPILLQSTLGMNGDL